MQRYQNLQGNSGVSAYEIGNESITIKFADGDCYCYDYASTGRNHVEHMKKLAYAGYGLSSFISQHVRERYAAKWKCS